MPTSVRARDDFFNIIYTVYEYGGTGIMFTQSYRAHDSNRTHCQILYVKQGYFGLYLILQDITVNKKSNAMALIIFCTFRRKSASNYSLSTKISHVVNSCHVIDSFHVVENKSNRTLVCSSHYLIVAFKITIKYIKMINQIKTICKNLTIVDTL